MQSTSLGECVIALDSIAPHKYRHSDQSAQNKDSAMPQFFRLPSILDASKRTRAMVNFVPYSYAPDKSRPAV